MGPYPEDHQLKEESWEGKEDVIILEQLGPGPKDEGCRDLA